MKIMVVKIIKFVFAVILAFVRVLISLIQCIFVTPFTVLGIINTLLDKANKELNREVDALVTDVFQN